jgi:hypothetical protein
MNSATPGKKRTRTEMTVGSPSVLDEKLNDIIHQKKKTLASQATAVQNCFAQSMQSKTAGNEPTPKRSTRVKSTPAGSGTPPKA